MRHLLTRLSILVRVTDMIIYLLHLNIGLTLAQLAMVTLSQWNVLTAGKTIVDWFKLQTNSCAS